MKSMTINICSILFVMQFKNITFTYVTCGSIYLLTCLWMAKGLCSVHCDPYKRKFAQHYNFCPQQNTSIVYWATIVVTSTSLIIIQFTTATKLYSFINQIQLLHQNLYNWNKMTTVEFFCFYTSSIGCYIKEKTFVVVVRNMTAANYLFNCTKIHTIATKSIQL